MNALIHKRNPWPLALCTVLLVGCGSDLPQKTTDTDTPTNPSGGDNTTPAQKYTVTTQLQGAAGGSISPSTQQVEANQVLVLTLSPLEGKAVDQVSGCGGTLGSDNRTFVTAPLASACTVSYSFRDVPYITDLSPTDAIRNVPITLTFKGGHFGPQMDVVLLDPTAGSCQAVGNLSPSQFTANCTFNKTSQGSPQVVLVRDTSVNPAQAIHAAVVTVKSNVDRVTWLGTGDSTRTNTSGTDVNPAIPYNQAVDFVVEGQQLEADLKLSIERCNNVQPLAGTASARKFRCTFAATAADPWITEGYKPAQVKSAAGEVLHAFWVRNTLSADLKDLSTLSVTGLNWCATPRSDVSLGGLGLVCNSASLQGLYAQGQDGEVQAGRSKDGQLVLRTRGQEKCVEDQQTGLSWEVKSSTASQAASDYWRSRQHRYTWYQSANNGGFMGSLDYSQAYSQVPAGSTCGNTLAGGFCNTQAYIARLNAQKYCGYNNWRLPTRMELVDLLDYGTRTSGGLYFGQGSETGVFEDQLADVVWTGSTASDAQTAWTVNFFRGDTVFLPKKTSAAIRAVRDSQ